MPLLQQMTVILLSVQLPKWRGWLFRQNAWITAFPRPLALILPILKPLARHLWLMKCRDLLVCAPSASPAAALESKIGAVSISAGGPAPGSLRSRAVPHKTVQCALWPLTALCQLATSTRPLACAPSRLTTRLPAPRLRQDPLPTPKENATLTSPLQTVVSTSSSATLSGLVTVKWVIAGSARTVTSAAPTPAPRARAELPRSVSKAGGWRTTTLPIAPTGPLTTTSLLPPHSPPLCSSVV
mmetsp:Transcript_35250/g.80495  ORF Transcript_35250/g.80495 Transcript_35250/m.80495 type:complete len:241 (+) Transcript_35250:303-1025(+)